MFVVAAPPPLLSGGCLRKSWVHRSLLQCSAAAVLKVLTHFEQGTLRIHFALSGADYGMGAHSDSRA